MEHQSLLRPHSDPAIAAAPIPIVALDVATVAEALHLAERLPRADYFKVGLQLYSAAGPEVVHLLKARGHRVFLDLKLHDIPNTVAGAVRAIAQLEVDLLTIHAAGGAPMLHAAVDAAASSAHPPQLFAVTVLTSLDSAELARILGRSPVDAAAEVVRFAALAESAGIDGVVASVHEVAAVRAATRDDFQVLTPGIRFPGGPAEDQARVATPAAAARARSDYVVLGRAVTAASDPAAAYERVLAELTSGLAEGS